MLALMDFCYYTLTHAVGGNRSIEVLTYRLVVGGTDNRRNIKYDQPRPYID
jgi:hypothetical protein